MTYPALRAPITVTHAARGASISPIVEYPKRPSICSGEQYLEAFHLLETYYMLNNLISRILAHVNRPSSRDAPLSALQRCCQATPGLSLPPREAQRPVRPHLGPQRRICGW